MAEMSILTASSVERLLKGLRPYSHDLIVGACQVAERFKTLLEL